MYLKVLLVTLLVQIFEANCMRLGSAETEFVPQSEASSYGRSYTDLSRAGSSSYASPAASSSSRSSSRSSPAFQPYLASQYVYKKSRYPDEFIQDIPDCMHVVNNDETVWRYRSEGQNAACGLYVVAEPQYLVEITIEEIDVDCSNGLLMIFDGWELNGKTFPIPEDHELDMEKRSHYFCSGQGGKKTILLSQNAGLVSYKVPKPGQGFIVSIRFKKNPEPCNILMSDTIGMFKMTNNGKARNCSLTTLLFPANMHLINLNVGKKDRIRRNNKEWIETQCSKMGSEDFVEVGGASELDSSNLLTSETICGYESKPAEKTLTVLCDSSTVRLVSSGNYFNYLTIFVKAASEEDLDFEKSMIMACPGMF